MAKKKRLKLRGENLAILSFITHLLKLLFANAVEKPKQSNLREQTNYNKDI